MNKRSLLSLFILLSLLLIAKPAWALPSVETDVDVALSHLKKYMPVLKNDRGERWPVLIWHGPLMNQRMMKAWGRRGIAALSTGQGRPWKSKKQPEAVKKIIPYLKWQQAHNQPVIVLAQSWMSFAYYNSRGLVNHVPPAKQASVKHKDIYVDYACPSVFYDQKRLQEQRHDYVKIARTIKDAGVDLTAILIDFEHGAILRNTGDHAKYVVKSARAARRCSRCVQQFGLEALSSLRGYQRAVNQARGYAIRKSFVQPMHSVFSNVDTGNYYAWPIVRAIRRHPQRYQGRYPAYGYAGSGMNIFQPRCYFVPGWSGVHALDNPPAKTRKQVGWDIFWYCLDRFSRAAKVMHPDEKLVPWVGWLLFRKHQQKFYAHRPVPYMSAYREMVIQTMMRGAETFCIFAPNLLTDPFIDGFPKENYLNDLGPFLFNVLPVQQAYDRMLDFNHILRKGRVLNYHISGGYGKPQAVWSGVATDHKALIRTVAFGKNTSKTIEVFGKKVTLPFHHRGQFFWVYPDGHIQPITRVDYKVEIEK